jgi:hypothetical protein
VTEIVPYGQLVDLPEADAELAWLIGTRLSLDLHGESAAHNPNVLWPDQLARVAFSVPWISMGRGPISQGGVMIAEAWTGKEGEKACSEASSRAVRHLAKTHHRPWDLLYPTSRLIGLFTGSRPATTDPLGGDYTLGAYFWPERHQISTTAYSEAMKHVLADGLLPTALRLHLSYQIDRGHGGLMVIGVWDTIGERDAFDHERLFPALMEAGIIHPSEVNPDHALGTGAEAIEVRFALSNLCWLADY